MILKSTISLILMIFILIGCGEDQEQIVSPESSNRPPIIDKLIIPSEITAGSKVALQVLYRDPDKDPLTVNWEISGGTFDKSLQQWTAPVEPAHIKVIVYVSDGINKPVEASGMITVISPPSPPPASTEPPTNPVVADPPVLDPIPKEEWQLLPAQGIAWVIPDEDRERVLLGQTFNELKNLYGVPIEAGGTFVFRSNRLGEFACLFQNDVVIPTDKVLAILTVDPRYKTKGGNGIGSTRNKIRREFGAPVKVEIGFDWYDGIAVDYDDSLRVNLISIHNL